MTTESADRGGERMLIVCDDGRHRRGPSKVTTFNRTRTGGDVGLWKTDKPVMESSLYAPGGIMPDVDGEEVPDQHSRASLECRVCGSKVVVRAERLLQIFDGLHALGQDTVTLVSLKDLADRRY